MKKILIVDDHPHVKELLKATLEVFDYEIGFAENGQEALGLAFTDHPDVILLDIMMPGIDGLEVCRRLKAQPATDDISIILLSARGQQEDVAEGLAAGADDYFVKPFSPIALIQKLEKLLQNQHAHARFYRTPVLQLSC